MASTFVPFCCESCDACIETFASAVVWCGCGRRCRLPEWARAQLKRREVSEGRRDSRNRSAGQSVEDSANRGFSASDSGSAHPEAGDSGAEGVSAGQRIVRGKV